MTKRKVAPTPPRPNRWPVPPTERPRVDRFGDAAGLGSFSFDGAEPDEESAVREEEDRRGKRSAPKKREEPKPAEREDADFNEEDHPRDEQGKFTDAGGSSSSSSSSASSTSPKASKVPPIAKKAEPKTFRETFAKAMAGNPMTAFVSHYSEEELSKMTCLTAHGGKVGCAIKDHGDGRIEATALFNAGGPKGSGRAMLREAVEHHGANYVECFTGVLNTLYESVGFVEDERYPFNKEYAPPGWNYEAHDHPDYVTMRFKGS